MVNASFTEARTRFILARLQNQVLLGKRAESGFKPEAWQAVTSEFNENFCTDFTRAQLKGHFQTQKKSYVIVHKLRGLSGFGWNDSAQLVVAEPVVWNKYIAANPKARQFRDKPFVLYDDFHLLVGNTSARGELRRTAKRAHNTLTAEEAALDETSSDEELPESVFDPIKTKARRTDASTSAPSSLKRTDTVSILHGPDPSSPKAESKESPSQAATDSKDDSTRIASVAQTSEVSIVKKEDNKKDRKGERSSARRSRANGTKALADAMEGVVKLEQERGPPAPTVFVKEKHGDMKKAIALFLKEAKDHISNPDHMQVGAKFLRSEMDAAYFISVSQAMRWEWMLDEIRQHVRMSPSHQSLFLPDSE